MLTIDVSVLIPQYTNNSLYQLSIFYSHIPNWQTNSIQATQIIIKDANVFNHSTSVQNDAEKFLAWSFFKKVQFWSYLKVAFQAKNFSASPYIDISLNNISVLQSFTFLVLYPFASWNYCHCRISIFCSFIFFLQNKLKIFISYNL